MTTATPTPAPVTEQSLTAYICNELLFGTVSDLSPTDDLLASGLLDSMAVVTLVGFLEQLIGRRIPEPDITVEHFTSVATICCYVDRQASDADDI